MAGSQLVRHIGRDFYDYHNVSSSSSSYGAWDGGLGLGAVSQISPFFHFNIDIVLGQLFVKEE